MTNPRLSKPVGAKNNTVSLGEKLTIFSILTRHCISSDIVVLSRDIRENY